MVLLARPKESRTQLISRLENHLSSGRAFEVFSRVVAAQGGDVNQLIQTQKLPTAKHRLEVRATDNGFVSACDVRELGLTIVELGGGRRRASDRINPAVGLSALKRVGDKITQGDILAVIHADSSDDANRVSGRVRSAYSLSDQASAEALIWRYV
jgi:thymidine phosphorylase